jgi:arginine decarboxylase
MFLPTVLTTQMEATAIKQTKMRYSINPWPFFAFFFIDEILSSFIFPIANRVPMRGRGSDTEKRWHTRIFGQRQTGIHSPAYKRKCLQRSAFVPKDSKKNRRLLCSFQKKFFFVKGVGKEKERLASFEMALRDASIAEYNLVKVTSIFPPRCKVISPKEGVKRLKPGQILYVVLAESSTNEPNRLIAASIGVAIPKDANQYGYLSEHHSYGETQQKVGEYAEDLAAYMLATTLGISFEEDVVYDSRQDLWRIKKDVVTTKSVTQTAVGEKNGVVDDCSGCSRDARLNMNQGRALPPFFQARVFSVRLTWMNSVK